jgi:hypothetical protein
MKSVPVLEPTSMMEGPSPVESPLNLKGRMTARAQLLAALRGTQQTERRVFVRRACDVAVFCRPLFAGGGECNCPARIRNISRGGVCLVVERRFEVGTVLCIEPADPRRDGLPTLLTRVVHLHILKTGVWAVGGVLPQPMSEEELAAFC